MGAFRRSIPVESDASSAAGDCRQIVSESVLPCSPVAAWTRKPGVVKHAVTKCKTHRAVTHAEERASIPQGSFDIGRSRKQHLSLPQHLIRDVDCMHSPEPPPKAACHAFCAT